MKIIVIGMNPGNQPIVGNKINKNSTFDRLNNWMNEAGIKHYSFMNTFDEITDRPHASMVDHSRFKYLDEDYIVLALGGFASNVLNKKGIEHLKLPHPSPRNRLFNDKSYEGTVIKQLKEFINENCNSTESRTA